MSDTRPNLFIVGAPKCGTTAWVQYLSHHPDIFFSEEKEPHYFNTDIPGFRWYKDRDKYLKLFANAGRAKVIGESSILYLYSRDAAVNIGEFNPEAKILIFVRTPADFIHSYHQQLLYNLDENNEDLGQVWAMAGHRKAADTPIGCRDPQLLDYKSVGSFGEQAQRYVDHLGMDRVRIVRFEEWTRDPSATHLALMDFLGIEDDGQTEFPKINAAHDHRSKAIATLTQRPPRLASFMSRTIRKLPGASNIRPVHLLRKLNRSEGYRSSVIDIELQQAIADHYYNDQAHLEALIAQIGLAEK